MCKSGFRSLGLNHYFIPITMLQPINLLNLKKLNMEANKISQKLNLEKLMPKTNVSTIERILMVAGGAYVVYQMLCKKDNSKMKMALAGGMLFRGMSGYCPMYDIVDSSKDGSATDVKIRVKSTINRPILQVYAFWRNLENLPKFMNHLQTVDCIDDITSKWTAKGPLGVATISWDAKITREEKDKYLSWKSLPGAAIDNSGKVSFKPVGQSTEIDVTISYRVPLGVIGEGAAKLVNPYFEKMVKNDIENLKYYLESGQQ